MEKSMLALAGQLAVELACRGGTAAGARAHPRRISLVLPRRFPLQFIAEYLRVNRPLKHPHAAGLGALYQVVHFPRTTLRVTTIV